LRHWLERLWRSAAITMLALLALTGCVWLEHEVGRLAAVVNQNGSGPQPSPDAVLGRAAHPPRTAICTSTARVNPVSEQDALSFVSSSLTCDIRVQRNDPLVPIVQQGRIDGRQVASGVLGLIPEGPTIASLTYSVQATTVVIQLRNNDFFHVGAPGKGPDDVQVVIQAGPGNNDTDYEANRVSSGSLTLQLTGMTIVGVTGPAPASQQADRLVVAIPRPGGLTVDAASDSPISPDQLGLANPDSDAQSGSADLGSISFPLVVLVPWLCVILCAQRGGESGVRHVSRLAWCVVVGSSYMLALPASFGSKVSSIVLLSNSVPDSVILTAASLIELCAALGLAGVWTAGRARKPSPQLASGVFLLAGAVLALVGVLSCGPNLTEAIALALVVGSASAVSFVLNRRAWWFTLLAYGFALAAAAVVPIVVSAEADQDAGVATAVIGLGVAPLAWVALGFVHLRADWRWIIALVLGASAYVPIFLLIFQPSSAELGAWSYVLERMDTYSAEQGAAYWLDAARCVLVVLLFELLRRVSAGWGGDSRRVRLLLMALGVAVVSSPLTNQVEDLVAAVVFLVAAVVLVRADPAGVPLVSVTEHRQLVTAELDRRVFEAGGHRVVPHGSGRVGRRHAATRGVPVPASRSGRRTRRRLVRPGPVAGACPRLERRCLALAEPVGRRAAGRPGGGAERGVRDLDAAARQPRHDQATDGVRAGHCPGAVALVGVRGDLRVRLPAAARAGRDPEGVVPGAVDRGARADRGGEHAHGRTEPADRRVGADRAGAVLLRRPRAAVGADHRGTGRGALGAVARLPQRAVIADTSGDRARRRGHRCGDGVGHRCRHAPGAGPAASPAADDQHGRALNRMAGRRNSHRGHVIAGRAVAWAVD
jgi:hypothetical protein